MPDVCTTTAPSSAPTTSRFNGSWLVYRKTSRTFSGKAGGGRMPRVRHPNFGAAEAEANRLVTAHPDSTFVILQECAAVKMRPLSNPADTGGAPYLVISLLSHLPRYKVDLINLPGMRERHYRRWPDHASALQYAQVLQREHGWPIRDLTSAAA